MNIVFVTQALPYVPSRDGFRLYGAQLIRCLSRRHAIDLISLAWDGDCNHIGWAENYCHSVTSVQVRQACLKERAENLVSTYAAGEPLLLHRELGSAVRAVMERRGSRILHVEGGWVGGMIPHGLSAGGILSLHDSGTRRCEQMRKCSKRWRERVYYRLRGLVEPRYERLVYARFGRCVVVAEADAKALRIVIPELKVSVIPNGIDTEYFKATRVSRQYARLIFHGNLSYLPNIECAAEFARDIFPRVRKQIPQAVFHLIGAQPDARIRDLAALPGVQLSADVPDLREAVSSGQVYVCPMRHGSGVKNKILEAMALRIPVVCYPSAVEGIECLPGRHFLGAADRESFAASVLELIENPQKAEVLAQAARSLVVEQYSWESRAEAFEQIYGEVLEEEGVGPRGGCGPQLPLRTTARCA